MFNPLRTRRGRLEQRLRAEIIHESPDTINQLMIILDEYERDNINTIKKLKRIKKIELNKINGALKQCINAHGTITKELITSASKRIHGALLDNNQKSISTVSRTTKLLIITAILFILYVICKVFIIIP